MSETSANDLERVEIALSRIARDYTSASQELDQYVITLEGAVSHVMEAGPQGWKGRSGEAFVGAWLERKARMQQASQLMSEAAGYLNAMVRTIEDQLPGIRAEQSIQLQAVFKSMSSDEQQQVLDAESQAQQAIVMALNMLNGQLEQMGEEVGMCPQEDREAGEPNYERNISRNDAGGGSGGGSKTPEQRIEDVVADPLIAEILIEQANLKGANLEDVATLLENGVEVEQVNQWMENGVNLKDVTTLLNSGVSVETANQWIENGVNLSDATTLLNKGVSADAITGLNANQVDLKDAARYVDGMLNKGYTIDNVNITIKQQIGQLPADRWGKGNIPRKTIGSAIKRWINGIHLFDNDGTPYRNTTQYGTRRGNLQPSLPQKLEPLTEYTVSDDPHGLSKGLGRILIDRYGNVYYFPDHYHPDTRIPVPLKFIIELFAGKTPGR